MHFPSVWFRFNRYVVADGYIRPARGAKLEVYAPWAGYQRIRELSGTDPVAYHGLMNVLDSVRVRSTHSRKSLRAKYTLDEERLLTWVAKNGLLGLAHSQLMLSSAPVRVSSGDASQRGLTFFSGGRWCEALEEGVPDAEAAEESWVVTRSLVGGEVLRTAAGPWWRRFLPGVGNAAQPDLGTEAFRRAYAEPLNEFIDVAVNLRTAIRAINPAAAEGTPESPSFELGTLALNGFLAPGATSLSLGNDGRLQETWTAPSLLAHLAMMVLRDAGDHRHLVKCEVCGNSVIRSKPSKYCGEPHRLTAEKRRQRAKAAGKQKRGAKKSSRR